MIGDGCGWGGRRVGMRGIMGGRDEMVIMGGMNVLGWEVESVMVGMKELEGEYMLVVEGKKKVDSVEVEVEVGGELLSEEMGWMVKVKKRVCEGLKSVLWMSGEVKVVEGKRIRGREGKWKGVIDKGVLV